jgi:hypothetical protein
MAKKKQESGPGTFMILVLVFFILASLILGVTTYLGYKGQEELEAQAKGAAEKQKAAEAQANEQLTRRNFLRVINGTEDPDDRKDLAGAAQSQAAAILDERKKVMDKLGGAGTLPGGKGVFDVPLQAGPDGAAPAVAPTKTIPQIAKEWEKIARDAQSRYEEEKRNKEKALVAAQNAQNQQKQDKDAFDASVKALSDQMAAKIKNMDAAFLALKTEAEKAGLNFKNIENQWAEEKTRLEERVAAELANLGVAKEKIKRLENPDPSDITGRFDRLNPARMAERMGTITDKSDDFVNIQFKQRIVLIPGQTFVVIPPNRSLVEVLDREKALEKHHHEFTSLGARDPFSGNELIKGMVEITDVTGADTARARITDQSAPIRDPLAKGDQLFNMTLNSGDKEHVAFAGIVDLDGDGRPDTEQFIRLLEKNNLVVDAYLDLKTGEMRGKGMNSGTRFLILGPDAPDVGKIKTMKEAAKTNGSQLIDARVFMSLIGIKPPKGAATPNYASVNLGSEGAAPKDPADPMAPAADPKK